MESLLSLAKNGPALDAINRELESLSLNGLLRWSLEQFGERIAHVTSFGPSGMVILDHVLRLRPELRVITLDTQFLFDETYDLWATVRRRYGIRIEIVRPELSPEEQARQYGPNLWEHEADRCCNVRKVKPMAKALAGLSAWYTGVRRDQSGTRAATPLLAWDTRYELFKLSPLANWGKDEVWSYIHAHDLPYNSLHDSGYSSIGCTHCTRPAAGTDDERAGRWAGLQKTECGLHWATPGIGAYPA